MHKNHNVPAVCKEEDTVKWTPEAVDEAVEQEEGQDNSATDEGEKVDGEEYTVLKKEGDNVDTSTLMFEEEDNEDNQDDGAEDIDEEERQILSLEKEKTLVLIALTRVLSLLGSQWH